MTLKNLNKNFLINLILVLSIFLFDRLSKLYVIYLDKKFFASEIFSSKFLNINLIWNEGIAFGLLSLKEESFYDILTLIIALVIFIIFFMLRSSEGFKRYSLLMILGGALGNIYDRIFYKAVPDFIDFHVGNFHWFIFNIADIFITIGVVLMILIELFEDKNEKYENL
tara:strand:+ start:100 stop:603 length:504 start_codon:yes stop_codon:yes gene_type:complete